MNRKQERTLASNNHAIWERGGDNPYRDAPRMTSTNVGKVVIRRRRLDGSQSLSAAPAGWEVRVCDDQR
jgi:hypothetical protein